MPTVLITGGTGLVGKRLSTMLKEAGFDVAILSQVKYNKSDFPIFYWNWQNGEVDEMALKNSDYIIHLAGANIAGQAWSAERKKLIIDSRVKSAEFLHQKIQDLNLSPKAFISASATGYYGAVTKKKVFREVDAPASDFLGETCRLWEEAAAHAYDPRIRTVQLRTGIVLTAHSGALEKMAQPIKFGFGAAIGKGSQYTPWIHIDDLCAMYIQAITDVTMHGPYNAVAPEHQTNYSMTKAIAKSFGKRIWMPNVPGFALKLIFGEMAQILLYGSRVSCQKIQDKGFTFKFPTLSEALADLHK